MASLGTVNLPVRVVLEGAEELLDQVALLRTLEKLGARNQQLQGDVKRLTNRVEEAEQRSHELAGMNAQWRKRCRELEESVVRVMPAEPTAPGDLCCGNGCCG